jgi:type VI secretion system protein ImpL
VVVTANLKIVGTTKASAAAAPQANQGFKRLKLPDTIVSASAAGAASVTNAAPGAAQ